MVGHDGRHDDSSAAPMILLYARVARHASGRHPRSWRSAGARSPAGYLRAGLGSALSPWRSVRARTPRARDGMTMWSVNGWLTGALFLAAALYQLSPLKAACLAHCRSPAAFLARHGAPAARRLPLRAHPRRLLRRLLLGAMLLLFAAGIMNLVWIAGLDDLRAHREGVAVRSAARRRHRRTSCGRRPLRDACGVSPAETQSGAARAPLS